MLSLDTVKQTRTSMNAPPAIGLVAPLPPQVGGIASVAEWLLDHQGEIGCRYVTFDLERSPFEEMGGRFYLRSVPRQLRLLVRFIRWLRRAPRVVHYCVACTRTGLLRDLVFIVVLRLFGKTTIAHIHGSGLVPAAESPFFSRVLRWIGRLTSERVSLAASPAAVIARLGVTSRSILNPLRFEPNGPPRRTRSPWLRLLFVGTYGERKGCAVLIDALARARQDGVEARLRFVGKEEYRGQEEILRRQVRDLGLTEAVEFAGLMPSERLPSCYQDADVLCLLSFREGLPMALLEAMAFGLPVLATPVGGIPDVVEHERTGLLVEPGDVEGSATAIRELAGDPDRRTAIGNAARQQVRALAGSDVITAEWRRLYDTYTGE